MQRLLLYVHFNKFNFISGHVLYQLEKIRPLYSRVVFISNSQLSEDVKDNLSSQNLVDDILERQNIGFDFAAWRDGMKVVGFEQLANFDSVTLMNDTCFGPLWDLKPIYQQFEHDEEVDFWGVTNYRKDKDMEEYDLHELVWSRIDYEKSYYEDFYDYIITGHTPTLTIPGMATPASVYRKNQHIAIDCGACFEGGRLAAICLDTGEEFYSQANMQK